MENVPLSLACELKTTSEFSCIWSDVDLLNILIKCDHVFPSSVCVLSNTTLEKSCLILIENISVKFCFVCASVCLTCRLFCNSVDCTIVQYITIHYSTQYYSKIRYTTVYSSTVQ